MGKESPIIYIGRAGADSIRHWRDNTGYQQFVVLWQAMLAMHSLWKLGPW